MGSETKWKIVAGNISGYCPKCKAALTVGDPAQAAVAKLTHGREKCYGRTESIPAAILKEHEGRNRNSLDR